MPTTVIPFNKPYLVGDEILYLRKALEQNHLSGNGPFTKACQKIIEASTGCPKVFLTHSATAGLEMSGLLLGLKSGDEVIMPSYTFVSTASAFLMAGAVPVFVDIRPDTLNIDETKIEQAITDKTRAIVVVHYAGVSCEMDAIQRLASKFGLAVIEDAAHSFDAFYKGKALGTLGNIGIYSFHETKNIISGEGGALIVNDASRKELAEIIWEKGTNRSQFFRGEVDKYTWVMPGSSYLPNELTAAVLYAQLQHKDKILKSRLEVWSYYHEVLSDLEKQGFLRRPIVPDDCEHNGHLYYILVENALIQEQLLAFLKRSNIHAVFHYVPLHSSPAGLAYCRTEFPLPCTEDVSQRLIRLPFWTNMKKETVNRVIDQIYRFFKADNPLPVQSILISKHTTQNRDASQIP